MRVLLLTQYYPPEMGAAQQRLASWVQALKQAGHAGTVLTAMPNYPTGRIFEEYRGLLWCEEEVDGVRVIRTWVWATRSKGFVPRLLNYLSFVVMAGAVGLWKVGKQDRIVVEMPPLFLGVAGVLLSRLKAAKLVLNVSDLWPASAVALGVLRNRLLIVLAEWLEAFLYRRAVLITGQTQGIVEGVRSRCRVRTRVCLIPNGADVERLACGPAGELEAIREKYGLKEKFVVGYAGLHGLAQGLTTVVGAAEILSGHPEIFFAFFGDGAEKDKLVCTVRERRLANVGFWPAQPTSGMVEIYALFNVAIVPLRQRSLFKSALPSKMFEAMAAGIPVILSAPDGEARKIVEEGESGIVVEPENPQALADAILLLYRERALRQRLGQNGHRYVAQRYNRPAIAQKFAELLVKLEDPGKGPPDRTRDVSRGANGG